MNVKRTTIVVVACAALAAWFSAAMTPGGHPSFIETNTAPRVDVSGAALSSEIARLRERLRPEATPRERIRNPFAFRSSRAVARPTEVRPRMFSPPAPVVPLAPVLTLAGLAEDAGPDGPVRTAIISGGGQLFLVKAGETLSVATAVYKVASISASSVELSDLSDGSIRHLALK